MTTQEDKQAQVRNDCKRILAYVRKCTKTPPNPSTVAQKCGLSVGFGSRWRDALAMAKKQGLKVKGRGRNCTYYVKAT
jgi:hypothetical protein